MLFWQCWVSPVLGSSATTELQPWPWNELFLKESPLLTHTAAESDLLNLKWIQGYILEEILEAWGCTPGLGDTRLDGSHPTPDRGSCSQSEFRLQLARERNSKDC